MIADHYNSTAIVKRLTGTTKKTYTTHLASVPCLVQSRDESITEDINTAFGKNFLMFCDVADIIESDRVVIDSKEYRIVGIKTFGDSPYNKHLEIVLRIFQS
jgi:hypothetical protein